MNEATRVVGYTKELEPGRMYFLRPYSGSCDACGAKIVLDNAMVMLVGTYVDERGLAYWLVDNYLYDRCPSCGKFFGTFKLYFEGLNANKFSLFDKVTHANN